MGALYRVKSNLDINGRFWGLDFEHGEAVTNRDDLARRLKSLGYTVEVATSAMAEATQTPADEAIQPEAQATDDGKPVCPVCGKICGSKAVLTRHMNKEHPQE